MTLADALLALEKAGGGLTIIPTGTEVFVPVDDGKWEGWRRKTFKRRSGDDYTTMVVRGIEKTLGED